LLLLRVHSTHAVAAGTFLPVAVFTAPHCATADVGRDGWTIGIRR